MIYFDNSATTPINSDVLSTYTTVSENFVGNPSSLHRLGQESAELLEISRQQLKKLMNLKEREIIFTSGGTEGDNLAIKGVAYARKISGRHIIVSAIEHDAVLKSAKELENSGFDVTYLKPNQDGIIEAGTLEEAIRPDTTLVSIMAVNNETGAIQPLHEISKVLSRYSQIVFHVDAVQAVGKQLESLYSDDRIDLLTFSAHKFHGPRGVGFVVCKSNRHITPIINGGGQENNIRSGTENTPAIAAMTKAFRLALAEEEKDQIKYQKMKQKLVGILSNDPSFYLISKADSKYTPSIISFSVIGVKGETVVHYLESKDIYISTTSACSSRDQSPSHVLTAMNLPQDIIKGALRVSLGSQNTLDEMDTFIKVLKKMKKEIKVIN